MNRKCPRCGSLCPIYAREIGRTQDCWDCGARLVLREDGLHLAEGQEAEAEVEPMPRAKSRPAAGGYSAWADPFTWLFAAGAVVGLLCQVLPMVQKASLSSIEARLLEGDLAVKKARRELDDKYEQKREPIRERERKLQARGDALAEKRRKQPDLISKEDEAIAKEASDLQTERDKVEADIKTAFREDEDALTRQQNDWNKKRSRIELEERGEAEISALSRAPWFSWGTLGALLLLTVGSLGFLSPRHPTTYRVLGVIVLAGLILFLLGMAAYDLSFRASR
jgi:Skp family chaperone for outer membrane proteins